MFATLWTMLVVSEATIHAYQLKVLSSECAEVIGNSQFVVVLQGQQGEASSYGTNKGYYVVTKMENQALCKYVAVLQKAAGKEVRRCW